MTLAQLDTEARTLLAQIAERHAFRHHAAVNLRGHGMQFLDDPSDLRSYLDGIEFHLGLLEQVRDIHAEVGGSGLSEAIMPRMERVPYPESRLELACCLAITRRGERAAAKSYVECAHAGFADVSRQVLEAERGTREEDLMVSFCRHEDHRAIAQDCWARWIQLCLGSVGRPGSIADRRTVETGLRDAPAVGVVRVFLDDLEPLREACSLSLPMLDDLVFELPEDLRGRFPSS